MKCSKHQLVSFELSKEDYSSLYYLILRYQLDGRMPNGDSINPEMKKFIDNFVSMCDPVLMTKQDK